MRVLVLGVQPLGIGIEVARELLTQGCSVSVADAEGFHEEELAKALSEAAGGVLAMLPVVPDNFDAFDAVVATDTARHELVLHSEMCHAGGQVFCCADVLGLVGFVFLDAAAAEESSPPKASVLRLCHRLGEPFRRALLLAAWLGFGCSLATRDCSSALLLCCSLARSLGARVSLATPRTHGKSSRGLS